MPIEELKVSRSLFDKRFTRSTGPFVRTCGIAMLCLFMLMVEVSAQTIESEWNVETRFYLSGMSFYWAREDASASYDTLAATSELRFRSDSRPWYASLFADYRYSTDSSYSDKWNIGGLIKYGRYRWDATAYAFVNK